VDQDEWCKAAVEFSFYDKDDRSLKGYGAAFFTRVGYPMIVDGVKLYQQYENGWRLVPEPYGVCNGDFEADLKGPEKLTAVNGLGGITLNWAMPSSTFKTNIYKDGVFAKEIPAGTNMARFEAADGIEAGKPYTFELRAVNGSGTESAGVSVKAMAYAAEMLDSYKEQFADWEFSNDPANGKIRLTTTGYSDGCALEFLDHQLAHPTWKPGIRNIRTSKGEHLTEGDIWRWKMWVKPTKVNIDGTYTIESIQTLIGGSTARTEFKTFTDAAGNPVNPKSLATDDWVLATSEERTIAAADKNNSWCTLLFASACIIDNISMEKKNAEGGWAAAPSNMVMNGSFRTNSDQEKPLDGVLTASAVNGTAKLSWSYSASGDVCGYQVLRDGELIATLSRAENSYEDSGLAEGVEYTYVVKAVDNCNNLSDGAEAKVVSVPVEYSVTGASVPEKVDEGENTVTVNVENFLISGGMKAELVLGLYKDGKLTNVQTSGQRVISKGAKVPLTAHITAPALADGAYTVRVFIFDGISTLMPLSPVQKIQE
jgi:hypothetical protein